jgi:hypothetical protein
VFDAYCICLNVCFASGKLLAGKILNKSVTFLSSNLPHLFFWQSSLDALEKKNLALELGLVKAQKDSYSSIEKLQEVEHKCSELQQNVKR